MMDFEDIDRRLVNWARWSRESRKRGRVYSAEGGWRPPQIWYPPGPKWAVDVEDARVVDRALLRLPRLMLWLLKYWYCARMRKEIICRKLKIRFGLFDEQLMIAQARVLTLCCSVGKRP